MDGWTRVNPEHSLQLLFDDGMKKCYSAENSTTVNTKPRELFESK